jgi:hypothetical protein
MIVCIHVWRIAVRALIISLSLLLSLPAAAHEVWFEPKSYVFPASGTLSAGLFNGQNFKGGELSYFEKTFRRFDLALGNRVEPLKGRTGDKPALNTAALGEGLHVALYESAGDTVYYAEYVKFESFVRHKDFKGTLEQHKQRGLPEGKFSEYYRRYVKALFAVGGGAGEDRAYGLETEIVALKNPYTDDVSKGMPVRVLYRGAPRANAQIELFDKNPEGKVLITLVRTNTEGVGMLPIQRGHSYLVDAVVLRVPEAGSKAEESKAVWETLWASMTFAVPQ